MLNSYRNHHSIPGIAGASPSFDQASYAISVDENLAIGTTLATSYVVTDADLPGDVLTYSLSGSYTYRWINSLITCGVLSM